MQSLKIFCTIVLFSAVQFCFAQTTVVNNNDNLCYAKLKTPDTYDEVTEEVLVRPASQKIMKSPAEYETITEQVLVQPESKKMIPVPAIFKMVEEQVLDKPEFKRMVTIPAVTENQTERVLVKEASTRLVAVPAVYESVTETIMVKPEVKSYQFIPAVFETVQEKMELKAAAERIVPVPAQYENGSEQVEVEAATMRIETLTPQIERREERVLVKPAHSKWVEKKGDENCLSADPQDCSVWCLVEIPAEYKTVAKMVNIGCDGSGIANSGCTKEIAVPAKYASQPKRNLVTPATTRKEMIPAEYTTVTRSILKTPAQVKEIITPAVYETYTKMVVKTPATTREETIPAEYKNVVKQVVITPATTQEEVIPAKYKMVKHQVIDVPASVREEIIPAVYKAVSKRVLKKAEEVRMEEIPAQYQTVTKKVLRENGDMQWQRIVCPKHQTPQMNLDMQKALREAGYDPGPNDNVFGPRTYAAMIQYQKDNNMWQGHLDYPTAKALGLTLLPAAYQDANGNNSQFANMMNGGSNGNGGDIAMTGKGDGNTGSSAGTTGGGTQPTTNINETKPASSSAKIGKDAAPTMSSTEMQMLAEINLMRKDPKGYVKYVEEYITQVQNDPMHDAAYKAEEVATARELINELKTLSPMSILKPHEGLHQVGIKHGKDVQGQGMIGHRGSDGTMPWDRVKRDTDMADGNENLVAGGESVRESMMILLVDSGIAGRGHRKTLLEPKWTHVGVNAIGDVGGIPNAWIQVFGKE